MQITPKTSLEEEKKTETDSDSEKKEFKWAGEVGFSLLELKKIVLVVLSTFSTCSATQPIMAFVFSDSQCSMFNVQCSMFVVVVLLLSLLFRRGALHI